MSLPSIPQPPAMSDRAASAIVVNKYAGHRSIEDRLWLHKFLTGQERTVFGSESENLQRAMFSAMGLDFDLMVSEFASLR